MNPGPVIQEAMSLASQGRLPEAAGVLEAAIRADAARAELHHALGQVLWHSGRQAEALASLERAVQAKPLDPAMRAELGRAQWSLGRLDEAAVTFREVVRLDPMQLASYHTLAEILLAAGREDEAWALLTMATRAFPGWPEPYRHWAVLASRSGDIGRAVEFTKQGERAVPRDTSMLAQRLGYMNFADGTDSAEQVALFRRLGTMSREASPRGTPGFANTKDPERPLRVAFLSPDFRFHACAFFLAGLIARLDRSRVVPLAYSFGAPDGVTQGFAAMCELRELSKEDPAAIHAQARADAVDIAVDCAGWSTGTRVEAMQPRLAPVQATYLGWPHTTGLPDMDYRFVDAVTDPPGSESMATERLVRLEECFVCFSLPEHTPEPTLSASLRAYAELADTSGPITFASFNRLEKVQDRAVQAWAKILQRVPSSRLLVKSAPYPGAQRYFLRRLSAAGVDASRVDWAPWEADPARHLAAFGHADIALDPFPYNGTTTTCESLLMSVPLIALRGDQHRSRVGASLLTAAGLPELVAEDEEGYVKLAVGLALDRARLLELHRTIRGRALTSPVFDASRYAVNFERALRTVWRAWCEGGVA